MPNRHRLRKISRLVLNSKDKLIGRNLKTPTSLKFILLRRERMQKHRIRVFKYCVQQEKKMIRVYSVRKIINKQLFSKKVNLELTSMNLLISFVV